jgi:hypothetical protein
MNHTPPGFKLSQAIVGFLQVKSAEARSPRTIESHRHHLAEWQTYAGEALVSRITTRDLTACLAYLRMVIGSNPTLATKTKGLSLQSAFSFWTTPGGKILSKKAPGWGK